MTVNEQIHTVIKATVIKWQMDTTPSVVEMREKWGGYDNYLHERNEKHVKILMEELDKAGFMLVPKPVATLLCKECEAFLSQEHDAFINQQPQS